MHASADETRTATGAAQFPRWTLEGVPGVAEHVAIVPDELRAAWHRVAAELAVSRGAVLLAAHAKVLGAMTGEGEVLTGYRATADVPRICCRLSSDGPSWRWLASAAARADDDAIDHPGKPAGDAETILDLTRPAGDLDPRTVLEVAAVGTDDQAALRLRYRTESMDAQQVARVAGYYLSALRRLTADVDADPDEYTLLSDDELRHQVHDLAGPHRDLPDRRVHELFEAKVRQHPNRIAAVHAGSSWTYQELNSRANRLARALLAQAVRPEDVIAVVTERDLHWLAAVLAIFKAGGTYLPIEPQFPAERIARTLSRAGCNLVLTEAGATRNLDVALADRPGARKLFIEDTFTANVPDDDVAVSVAAHQLAYIYFTSGSTGEPKGAMVEHAGMLNHLYAKIADLDLGEYQVVAQVAPQCFDISLWQLVSALLVGGRTLLVEQDVILDVPGFVRTVAEHRVGVIQVVPSYLEAVVSYLERQPQVLPDLRYVSVTGESVQGELIRRFFAVVPHVRLVNAYGLTETSDDTNHEVMDRPPAGDRVPLGRPIHNVHVYVLDERLRPVPLGAPGLIAFSGVCVGRGYINDPERTRACYLDDPLRPGQRLYLGGDYGRWRPDGKLEFLGRKDNQVKISGFRIEIGDVENALLQVPGVRGAAVVVDATYGSRLVAFYSGGPAAGVDAVNAVREQLGTKLPAYMIPSVLHPVVELPLTANGKVDRKQLTALAARRTATEPNASAPATPTERRLAAAWGAVLDLAPERIRLDDNFFDLGGTSLSAVKLAIALDRAVSLRDVTRHPSLAELAELVDGRS